MKELEELEQMLNEKLITKTDYQKKKKELEERLKPVEEEEEEEVVEEPIETPAPEEEKEPDLSIASKNLRKILEKRDKNAKR